MKIIEEFYNKAKGEELNLEQRKEKRFTYYDLIGFTSAYQSKNLISISKAQEYAEFCIRCDREGKPLLLIEDYIKHY